MRSEATFTAPTARCPHPGRWHAPDAWATEDEVTAFVAALCRLLRPSRVLETGTYAGDTAAAIGAALAEHGGHLDTLETDPERAAAAGERLIGRPEVQVRNVASLHFLPDAPYDLFFFDSDPDVRAAEMTRYRDYATPGAVWLLHDTASHPQLRRHLWRLATESVISEWMEFPTPRGLAMGRWV